MWIFNLLNSSPEIFGDHRIIVIEVQNRDAHGIISEDKFTILNRIMKCIGMAVIRNRAGKLIYIAFTMDQQFTA